MISKNRNFIYYNELSIDGFIRKIWIGKSIPKDVLRLIRLKGINLHQFIFRDGQYCDWPRV